MNAGDRAAALTVRCGLPGCDQPPGEPCVSTADSKFQRDNPHYNRWARGLQATSQQRAELVSARRDLEQLRVEYGQARDALDREKSRRSGCPNPITEGAPTMTTTNPGGEGGSTPTEQHEIEIKATTIGTRTFRVDRAEYERVLADGEVDDLFDIYVSDMDEQTTYTTPDGRIHAYPSGKVVGDESEPF